MNSGIYSGTVRHQRYSPKQHRFSYPLYMLALDIDELSALDASCRFFACERFAPLSFRRRDYLDASKRPLKSVLLEKVRELGGDCGCIDRVVMVCQVRCFGVYFSPINLFFCYSGVTAVYTLVEVNNTPWLERHFYLVDLNEPEITDKHFHVSPFMPMAMQYHWRLKAPDLNRLDKPMLVHIEAHQQHKVFDATMILKGKPLNNNSLALALRQWPIMTAQIVRGIYWQAFKLFIKSIPLHAHPRR